MALVVEDGTGLANAESYDSLAGISAELALTGEDAAWLALASDTLREQLARRGTRMLDTEWWHRGVRKLTTQALEYPRDDAYDDDSVAITGVPKKLKRALAQLCASGAVAGAELQPDQSTPGSIASESVSVAGVISESISYVGGKSAEVYYRKVEGLLRGLVEDAERLERA